MATKENILEQLVEEFLIHRGYFVRHNVKFLPSKDHADFHSKLDSNHSDIDVLGLNPLLHGADRVWAVSCKSWQSGFDPTVKISEIEQNKIVSGREAWKGFRELVSPKWSDCLYHGRSECNWRKQFHLCHSGDKALWRCRTLGGAPFFLQSNG